MVLQQFMAFGKNDPFNEYYDGINCIPWQDFPIFLTRDLVTPLVYFLGSNQFEPVC